MAAMKRTPAQRKPLLEAYLREMPHELDALRADVSKAGCPQLLPLDSSYESLDRLEDYLALVLDRRVPTDAAIVQQRAIRYVGTTSVECTGGRWSLPRVDDKHDPLCISKFPDAPKAELLPRGRVREFARLRTPGKIRDEVERFDLPLQRARIQELASSKDRVLAELRADATRLSGRDPGPFEGAPASMAALEETLIASRRAEVGRDVRRRVRRAAELYFGLMLQERLGPAEWTVCEKVGHERFGVPMIYAWWPSIPVHAVGSRSAKAGSLQAGLDYIVSVRSQRI